VTLIEDLGAETQAQGEAKLKQVTGGNLRSQKNSEAVVVWGRAKLY
jgi:hypothetical protein